MLSPPSPNPPAADLPTVGLQISEESPAAVCDNSPSSPPLIKTQDTPTTGNLSIPLSHLPASVRIFEDANPVAQVTFRDPLNLQGCSVDRLVSFKRNKSGRPGLTFNILQDQLIPDTKSVKATCRMEDVLGKHRSLDIKEKMQDALETNLRNHFNTNFVQYDPRGDAVTWDADIEAAHGT
eukprot:gene3354-640_t